MSYSAIPKTYATAFAEASTSLEEAEQELDSVIQIIKSEHQFRDFFDIPSVTKEEKERVLTKTFKGKISDITLNFLQVLLNRGRFSFLSEIHDAFKEELDRKAGRVRAKVRSYPALDDSQLAKLRDVLKDKFKSDFILEATEDPSLIGGFVVRFHDLAIDSSMKNQLRKLRQALLETKLPVGVVYEN